MTEKQIQQENKKPKYHLSVAAIFKNESRILKEWIEHYFLHGVEHIYLINDHSMDDFLAVLSPYLQEGKITLFQHTEEWSHYRGRQKDMYNHFFLPIVKARETKWLIMVDIDEYLWSPMSMDLKWTLQTAEHLAQIQVRSIYFGSNGFEKQPEWIVPSFTRRENVNCSSEMGNGEEIGTKYIINTDYVFDSLTIHHAIFTNPEEIKEAGKFIVVGEPHLRLNHYSCQSREYWDQIKCTRGDSDRWRIRVPADFEAIDRNEVEDIGLYEQNREMYVSSGV